MPSHSPPLSDSTTHRSSISNSRNFKAMPTKIPKHEVLHVSSKHMSEKELSRLGRKDRDREIDSDDSWANDSTDRTGSDDDDSEGNNASIFSEEDGGDESYPGDEEYGLGEEEEEESKEEESKEEESKEEAPSPVRVTKEYRRKQPAARAKPVTADPTPAISALRPLMALENTASFNGLNFLTCTPRLNPAPSKGNADMIKCVVIRDKRSALKSLFPKYTMYFQDGEDRIAMTAEKQTGSRSANYYIWDMTRGSPGMKLSKKSGNFMGKLRGDSSGAAYSLYNNSQIKEQVAAFVFQKVTLTRQLKEGQIPRKLNVILPAVTKENTHTPVQVTSDTCMITRFEDGLKQPGTVMHTKEPTFERGQYRLNFHGRVTTPSVKNFQITTANDIRDVLAQFGRVSDDRFHLDFKHPFSPFQAFSMAIAQFNL